MMPLRWCAKAESRCLDNDDLRHVCRRVLSFKFSAWWIVAVAATLASATLGDVLFARCSGSSLRVNLLPAHLVGELAAALGYAALLAKNFAATVQPFDV